MQGDVKINELFFVPARRRDDRTFVQTYPQPETDKMKTPLQKASDETAGTLTLEQFTEALQWLNLY